MYTVKLLIEAEDDFAEACEWYEGKVQGLGSRFYKSVESKLKTIRSNPLHYSVKFSEIYRFAPVKDFPFLISYRVNVDERTVYVISIFHTSRNPTGF